jgi:hypothetical protein
MVITAVSTSTHNINFLSKDVYKTVNCQPFDSRPEGWGLLSARAQAEGLGLTLSCASLLLLQKWGGAVESGQEMVRGRILKEG